MTQEFFRSSGERAEMLTSLRQLQALRKGAEETGRLSSYRFDAEYVEAAKRLFRLKFGHEPVSENDAWIQESNWLP
jgi:hypothetical protein